MVLPLPLMRTTLPWLVWRRAAQVTMSNPGSSWLSMPVTETVLPVLSKILTSDPARPPLAPLSIRDQKWEEECLDT